MTIRELINGLEDIEIYAGSNAKVSGHFDIYYSLEDEKLHIEPKDCIELNY